MVRMSCIDSWSKCALSRMQPIFIWRLLPLILDTPSYNSLQRRIAFNHIPPAPIPSDSLRNDDARMNSRPNLNIFAGRLADEMQIILREA